MGTSPSQIPGSAAERGGGCPSAGDTWMYVFTAAETLPATLERIAGMSLPLVVIKIAGTNHVLVVGRSEVSHPDPGQPIQVGSQRGWILESAADLDWDDINPTRRIAVGFSPRLASPDLIAAFLTPGCGQ